MKKLAKKPFIIWYICMTLILSTLLLLAMVIHANYVIQTVRVGIQSYAPGIAVVAFDPESLGKNAGLQVADRIYVIQEAQPNDDPNKQYPFTMPFEPSLIPKNIPQVSLYNLNATINNLADKEIAIIYERPHTQKHYITFLKLPHASTSQNLLGIHGFFGLSFEKNSSFSHWLTMITNPIKKNKFSRLLLGIIASINIFTAYKYWQQKPLGWYLVMCTILINSIVILVNIKIPESFKISNPDQLLLHLGITYMPQVLPFSPNDNLQQRILLFITVSMLYATRKLHNIHWSIPFIPKLNRKGLPFIKNRNTFEIIHGALTVILIMLVSYAVLKYTVLIDKNILNTPSKGQGAIITQIRQHSPASQELQVGDIIYKIEEVRTQNMQQTIDKIREHIGQPTQITYERNGQEITSTFTPRSIYPEGEGPLGVFLENNNYSSFKYDTNTNTFKTDWAFISIASTILIVTVLVYKLVLNKSKLGIVVTIIQYACILLLWIFAGYLEVKNSLTWAPSNPYPAINIVPFVIFGFMVSLTLLAIGYLINQLITLPKFHQPSPQISQ